MANVDPEVGPIELAHDEANRRRGPACLRCVCWDALTAKHGPMGLCRRNPPTMIPGRGNEAVWPVTRATDFCGAYVTAWGEASSLCRVLS